MAAAYSIFMRFRKLIFQPRQYFLGFGPLPINLNHAPAVRRIGGRAESFATHLYSIGGQVDVKIFSKSKFINFLIRFFCIPYFFSITRYTHVFFYFDGGALGNGTLFLWRIEALLYRLAGVKTILSAYGSDVHTTNFMRNLGLKNGYTLDYPNQWRRNKTIEARINYWCKAADFVLAGCDWVDYLPRWDKLVSSHFTLDVPKTLSTEKVQKSSPFRILHAPNHRNLKGSDAIERAIKTLIDEGMEIELTLLTGVSNTKVLEEINKHDIVIDQLIIGWYAQFALESIAHGVPTICFISESYLKLYSDQFAAKGMVVPFISADLNSVTDVIRFCCNNRDSLSGRKEDGRAFAEAFHSFEAIGQMFEEIIVLIHSERL